MNGSAASIEIRELNQGELTPALRLVWEVFSEFEAPGYSQRGIDEFKCFLEDQGEIANSRFYGALAGDEIVGALAMRGAHITLFFVAKAFHRQGIGKALFKYALERATDGSVTVNSSPYAVQIYQKLGFKPTGPEQTVNGITFTPMRYICAD